MEIESAKDFGALVMFSLVWVFIGFSTAVARWYWLESEETITHSRAKRQTALYYDKMSEHEKSDFFCASMIAGPIGTIIFLGRYLYNHILKMIK